MSALTGEDISATPVRHGPRPAHSPQLWSRSDRRWDRIRWGLLVGWLVVAVATVVTGERAASWDRLQAAVAAGEVDAVRVVGELSPRETGYSVVEVHWSHGPMRYTTEVIQVRGRQRPTIDVAPRGGHSVVREPPSRSLPALQPGLLVTQDRERTGGGRLLGWQVPNALGLFIGALCFAGLGVLVGGPEPWRATRWAWFWLSLVPLGGIVFLVASGPTPRLPGPRDANRRLTGFWAFVVGLSLASVLVP